MEFKFITHDNTDAYFNLASEEYLLKQTDGYYFYLWCWQPGWLHQQKQMHVQASHCLPKMVAGWWHAQ